MPPKTGRNCPDFGPIFPGITRERHRTPGNNKEGASIKIVLKNGKIWRAALRHAKINICPTFDKKRQFATKSGPPPGLSNPAGQDAPPRPPGTAAPPGLSPGRFPARCRHSPAGGCYQPGRPPRPPPPGLNRATGKRGRRPPGLPQLFASFREITTFAIAKPPGHPQPPGQNPPKKPENCIKRKQTRKQCRICGPFPPQPGNPYLIDNRRNTPIASAFLNIIPSVL